MHVKAFILALGIAVTSVTEVQTAYTEDAEKSADISLHRFPLRAFHVIGNNNFSRERILAVTQLEIGEEATPDDFQKALKYLSETGVFESIEFQYGALDDGYKVIFQVAEISDLYPVRFENIDDPSESLHRLLRKKVPLYIGETPPQGPMVELISSVLEQHLSKKTKQGKIVSNLIPRSENENKFDLVFQPPSTIKTIAFVTFTNTGDLSPLDLQRRFNQIAMGVPFSQPRLKELLLHNITPLYEQQGRLEVGFCPCNAKPDSETEGILVHVQVEQGPLYRFGEIGFSKNLPVDTRELNGLVLFRRGETADMSTVQKTLVDLEQRMKSAGYMRAFVRYDRNVRKNNRKVDITIGIRPGSLYRFGTLSITGLDIEGEAAVKKRWIFEPGDPFNANYPNAFLKRVHSMFDNLSKTDSKIYINETTKNVDVELIFQ